MSKLVQLDTGRKLEVECKDANGVVINLTGKTVNVHWRLNNGDPQNRAMTITNAAEGKAEYLFTDEDIPTGGEMKVEISIHDAGSPNVNRITSDDSEVFNIRSRISVPD